MFELFRMLIRMYEVKNLHSQEKMRETWVLFSETYSLRKTELLANVCGWFGGVVGVVLEV